MRLPARTEGSAPPGIPTAIECTDPPGSVSAPLGARGPRRGTVVACHREGDLDAELATRRAIRMGYVGPALRHSVRVFRVAYGTERLDGVPGISTALVFLPPGTGSEPWPIAVVAHGTTGLADACAPSAQGGAPIDMMALPLADAGFAVIATDYAGLGNGAGETVQGWGVAPDQAHSVLDAARAMVALLPAGRAGRVALIGYSQGGGAVLAAQPLVETYGADLEVFAVVAEAPAFFHPRFYADVIARADGRIRGRHELLHAFTAMWFFSHAAVYDGMAHAADPFAAPAREGVTRAMRERCVLTLGDRLGAYATSVGELYDPTFVASLERCLEGERCDETGRRWKARMDADLPALDPEGPPVLLLQGLRDGIVRPSLTRCTADRLAQSGTPVRICADAEAEHTLLPGRRAGFVNAYLAARLAGTREPPCESTLPACEEQTD